MVIFQLPFIFQVYDGPTAQSNKLLFTSGTAIPQPITSSGRQILVIFTTDYSVVKSGFNASYSVTKI